MLLEEFVEQQKGLSLILTCTKWLSDRAVSDEIVGGGCKFLSRRLKLMAGDEYVVVDAD